MILCVCLSPALDVTYDVASLTPGATHRVRSEATRPGGKGVNVARVLHALDEPVQLLAPCGGARGEHLARLLAGAGIPAALVPDDHETRRTVTVVEAGGRATMFTEPSSLNCWDEVRDAASSLLGSADALVVSGAVPASAPVDAVAQLVLLARELGRPSIVDTSGPALQVALEAGPTLVKPNADELAELAPGSEPEPAARELAERHGVAVVASLGADGLVAVTPRHSWWAAPSEVVRGNPTGAGDALTAGLARFLAHGTEVAPWDSLGDALSDSVALAMSAVRSPTAGEIDAAYYHELRGRILVRSEAAS